MRWFSSLSDRTEVYLGDENSLSLTFNARNEGEGGAYEAELYVMLPPEADYSGIARSNAVRQTFLNIKRLDCWIISRFILMSWDLFLHIWMREWNTNQIIRRHDWLLQYVTAASKEWIWLTTRMMLILEIRTLDTGKLFAAVPKGSQWNYWEIPLDVNAPCTGHRQFPVGKNVFVNWFPSGGESRRFHTKRVL